MKLTARDEQNVTMLKERYGFDQTSELVRFLLINTSEQVRREQQRLLATTGTSQ
jgi:hypothetical protein